MVVAEAVVSGEDTVVGDSGVDGAEEDGVDIVAVATEDIILITKETSTQGKHITVLCSLRRMYDAPWVATVWMNECHHEQ